MASDISIKPIIRFLLRLIPTLGVPPTIILPVIALIQVKRKKNAVIKLLLIVIAAETWLITQALFLKSTSFGPFI
jgi:hypothetical protein